MVPDCKYRFYWIDVLIDRKKCTADDGELEDHAGIRCTLHDMEHYMLDVCAGIWYKNDRIFLHRKVEHTGIGSISFAEKKCW